MIRVYGRRRHLLDIYADILTVASNEYTLISHIVGQSNLNFINVSRYLDPLLELVFLEKRDLIGMEKYYYLTTENGKEFLKYYSALKQFLTKKINKLHA